jgi:ACS family hexuronate transporter-like MFS transporter
LPEANQTERNFRWVICGLLFLATTVNYIDRQLIGILKPVLAGEFHWSEADYGWIVFSFQSAYALMMPIAGRLLDKLGVRLGYAIAVSIWGLASMSHAFARNFAQFALARFGLGIGEAANFPAAIKTVADWFPPQERAFATGIFNSGSNMGAIIAPLLVQFVAVRWGWRPTFLVTGALDGLWLIAWLLLFRKPAGVAAAQAAAEIPYGTLLQSRPAWAFSIGKLLTDPVWWFYLFWIPGFLNRSYGLEVARMGPPLVCIYLAADAGSILGGALPGRLVSLGWTLNGARKVSMLVCALAVTPVSVLFVVHSLWPAVALISLAAGAHQGWSANLYTLVSDTFPRSTVGSVVGLGGLAGAIGGMLVAPAVGYWLDFSKGAYEPLFLGAGSAYLLALGCIQLLAPRITARN